MSWLTQTPATGGCYQTGSLKPHKDVQLLGGHWAMGRASRGSAPGAPAGAKSGKSRQGGRQPGHQSDALAESPWVPPGSVIKRTTNANPSSPKTSSGSSKSNEKGSRGQERMK